MDCIYEAVDRITHRLVRAGQCIFFQRLQLWTLKMKIVL